MNLVEKPPTRQKGFARRISFLNKKRLVKLGNFKKLPRKALELDINQGLDAVNRIRFAKLFG